MSTSKKSEVIELEEEDQDDSVIVGEAIEVEDNSNEVVEVPVKSINIMNGHSQGNEILIEQQLTPIYKIRPQITLHSFDESKQSISHIKIYVEFLNQIIENIIVGISQYLELVPQQVIELSQCSKEGITLIAILNTGIIKKLNFIIQKMKDEEPMYNQSMETIKSEISYWQEYFFGALTDTRQQQARYGNGKE